MYSAKGPSNKKEKIGDCPLTPSYSDRLAEIGHISHFHDFEEPLALTDWDNWFESDV